MALPELEQIYLTYKDDVYRFLLRLTRSPQQAEDLLSETFLRVIRALPGFRGDCTVKTWLFGLARNVWLESLRKNRPTLEYDDLLDLYLEDDLADRAASRQLLLRVRELLAQKDSRARQVVYLRAAGYAYAEIAARLGVSESGARVLEHRTRNWLKTTLQKEGIWNDRSV